MHQHNKKDRSSILCQNKQILKKDIFIYMNFTAQFNFVTICYLKALLHVLHSQEQERLAAQKSYWMKTNLLEVPKPDLN